MFTLPGRSALLLEFVSLDLNPIYLLKHIEPKPAYQGIKKKIFSPPGEFSGPADEAAMKYLTNELKNRAEAYTQKLVTYLEDNKSLFTANIVPSEITGDKSQSNNSFDSGFDFDNDERINQGFY